MPDTVFFKGGKPNFLIKTDDKSCILGIQNDIKITLQDINLTFSQAIKRKKKKYEKLESIRKKKKTALREESGVFLSVGSLGLDKGRISARGSTTTSHSHLGLMNSNLYKIGELNKNRSQSIRDRGHKS
jgi:hypothetical protein